MKLFKLSDMILTKLQKCLYRYAYSFSRGCQKRNFFVYMKKYITKHVKYREKTDEYEYDILIVLTDNASCQSVIHNIKKEKNKLCEFLYNHNLSIYVNRRENYSTRVMTDEQLINKMTAEYNSTSKIHEREIIENIVRFSVKFQDVFMKSDLTAKTKIQEHWFMRLPIYTTCITIVYMLNVIDIQKNDYTKVVFMTIAYFLSLYLVAIRFHQSVSAETKKHSSELYSKEKNNLYVHLVTNLNSENNL